MLKFFLIVQIVPLFSLASINSADIEKILEQHPERMSLILELERQSKLKRTSTGSFWPSLSWSRTSNSVKDSGSDSSGRSEALSANLNLFNSGRDLLAVDQNLLLRESNIISAELSLISFYHRFYKAVIERDFFKRRFKTGTEIIATFENLFNIGQSRYRKGLISKSEISQLESQLLSIKREQIEVDAFLRQSALNLKYFDYDQSTSILSYLKSERLESRAKKVSFDDLRIQRKIEILVDIAKSAKWDSYANFAPRLDLNHTWNPDRDFQEESTTTTITASWTLFNSSAAIDRSINAKFDYKIELENRKKDLKLNQVDFSNLETEYFSNKDVLMLAERSWDLSETVLQQSEKDFRLGRLSITELLQQQKNHLDRFLAFENARKNFFIAKINYLKSREVF
ncbi:MAG: TolC family protein [Bdellovibrionales bacterium]